MPLIYVLAGRDVGRSFDANDGAVLGRGVECDVRLHDRSISRKHARLECVGGRWALVDLESRNGLRKHGARVQRAELGDRDEVLLGELPLRFRLTEGSPPPDSKVPPIGRPIDVVSPGEIELEEDIDLGVTEIVPAKEVRDVSEAELKRAQLLRRSSSGSLLYGELAQRPLWFRLLVYFGVLLFAAALCLGVYQLVAYMRGSL